MSEGDGNNPSNKEGTVKISGILKKAVSLGAGAYLSAEDTVSRTLNTVQIPKELVKEALENFFESYTLNIKAEIKLSPKKQEEEK